MGGGADWIPSRVLHGILAAYLYIYRIFYRDERCVCVCSCHEFGEPFTETKKTHYSN